MWCSISASFDTSSHCLLLLNQYFDGALCLKQEIRQMLIFPVERFYVRRIEAVT
jgi:hypothetical protein